MTYDQIEEAFKSNRAAQEIVSGLLLHLSPGLAKEVGLALFTYGWNAAEREGRKVREAFEEGCG